MTIETANDSLHTLYQNIVTRNGKAEADKLIQQLVADNNIPFTTKQNSKSKAKIGTAHLYPPSTTNGGNERFSANFSSQSYFQHI